ncbi:MAG: hypothetical protein ABSB22_09990 [Thermodesulfobacteriota bacterium]|jgi:hypothetical protein
MSEVVWIRLFNEGIPLLLLIGLGFALYRGFTKNQSLLSEREELLKRYLLFRGDKQVRLKIYEGDEKIYHELLKNLSSSWKNFKKTYDQCLLSLAQNTIKTKHLLQLFTLGLLVNSARLFTEEYLFFGLHARFLNIVVEELPYYVLVILSFLLLRTQTHKFLSLRGEAVKMDREILFFPNNLSADGEQEFLYDEFDPLEGTGAKDGKEDQNPHQRFEG